VGETSEGIIVRGAKLLGTLAPLADEIVSIQFGGVLCGVEALARPNPAGVWTITSPAQRAFHLSRLSRFSARVAFSSTHTG
jgi:hypothetical protein